MGKRAYKVIRKIAVQDGVSVGEVLFNMQKAIKHASEDPRQKQRFMKESGEMITPEEFIETIYICRDNLKIQ